MILPLKCYVLIALCKPGCFCAASEVRMGEIVTMTFTMNSRFTTATVQRFSNVSTLGIDTVPEPYPVDAVSIQNETSNPTASDDNDIYAERCSSILTLPFPPLLLEEAHRFVNTHAGFEVLPSSRSAGHPDQRAPNPENRCTQYGRHQWRLPVVNLHPAAGHSVTKLSTSTEP
jgi:hypothetical protein